jgi:hypothetical protein
MSQEKQEDNPDNDDRDLVVTPKATKARHKHQISKISWMITVSYGVKRAAAILHEGF